MTHAEILGALRSRFPSLDEIPLPEGYKRGPELYVAVPAESIAAVCRFLRFDPPLAFDYPAMITAIDWKDRFEVVYWLHSTLHNHKIVLKVTLTDRHNPHLPSVTGVWPGADWQEREIFDLFGIRLDGHYNLRRILLPDHWEGHPLRKDYVDQPDRYD